MPVAYISECGVTKDTGQKSSVFKWMHRDLSSRSGVCSKKLGDPSLLISERIYPVDFVSHIFQHKLRFSKIVIAEYNKGLSLSEIATKINKSKNFVRSCLLKGGVKLRNRYAEAMTLRKLRRGKQGARPYYGFCYFEGAIVKDPREYSTLVLIHGFWKEGMTNHQIVKELISRGLLSRTGRMWSWAVVHIIVTRFKDGLVKIKFENDD